MDKRELQEKAYAYWLVNVSGIGKKTAEYLLKACGGTAKEVYYGSEAVLRKVLKPKQFDTLKASIGTWDLEKEYDKLTSRGIGMVVRGEAGYPERLSRIPDPPFALFYLGELPLEQRLSVAIIGARDCSAYGAYVAEQLGGYLGSRGVQIISGMARGIDGISQLAALRSGGVSYGVMGCGVDVCYPAQNRKLYEKLKSRGGILSAYLPGTEAKAQHFPPRNRIVSGLADVVVVVEARSKSGTLITVDMALEQGKEVYVVPGRITDRLSDGCNSLIGQGAGVLLSPELFLEEIMEHHRDKMLLQMSSLDNTATMSKEQGMGLTEELQKVYERLDFYPQSVEEILLKTKGEYTGAQINAMLMQLCLLDCAAQSGAGHFIRKI